MGDTLSRQTSLAAGSSQVISTQNGICVFYRWASTVARSTETPSCLARTWVNFRGLFAYYLDCVCYKLPLLPPCCLYSWQHLVSLCPAWASPESCRLKALWLVLFFSLCPYQSTLNPGETATAKLCKPMAMVESNGSCLHNCSVLCLINRDLKK